MKKTIRYDYAFSPIHVGWSAYIHLTEDHPNTKTRDVHTSQIVRVEENGNFETLNTYYVKEVAS